MKNLMIYISPTGSFNNPDPKLVSNDAELLIKVQIENSLEIGWKPENILLYTNFEFRYGEVKAKVITDVEYFEPQPQAMKPLTIAKLFEKNLIEDNELYWSHDLDAFQLYPITETELEMDQYDVALTEYHFPHNWNGASVFFKKSSEDIFYKIREIMVKSKINEEKALQKLTNEDENIQKRVKKINRTYSFAPYSFEYSYPLADKPIRVAHFHPLIGIPNWEIKNCLNFYRGENVLHTPLLPKRLIKIFRYHRIR